MNGRHSAAINAGGVPENNIKAVLVTNPKGGSGKTTFATNLAGSLAARGQKVYMWDLDRQQSSLNWLRTRPVDRPAIHRLDARDDEEPSIRKHKTFVGIVGMRVDPTSKAAATLEAFLAQFKLPVLTYRRDSQVYVNAAFNGLSVFDLPDYVSARDLEQWQPLLDWLEED